MAARWHQDYDRWIWRVYEDNGVTPKGGEDVRDIYIVPQKEGWCIVSAKTLMESNPKNDWTQRVAAGEGVRIAGPFANENSAKAAWRLMWG
jgi:hypothetical protein